MQKTNRYLHKMEGSIDDKMRIGELFPDNAEVFLDVGCANGTLTRHIATATGTFGLGIDIDPVFVGIANAKNGSVEVSYQHMYLRDLLQYDKKFDAVVFASVLHEFYSYGEGTTSVIKALADAYELLKPGGRIIIRDMMDIAKNYMRTPETLLDAVWKQCDMGKHADFERVYGSTKWMQNMNHFLLKSMYPDNWEAEMQENYMPLTSTWYYDFLDDTLRMKTISNEVYLLPYICKLWAEKWGLDEDTLDMLYSTGMMCYEKGTDA